MKRQVSRRSTLFSLLSLSMLLFGTAISTQAQFGIAPVTREQVGERITCHVGNSSYSLKPDIQLIKEIQFAPSNVETQEIFNTISPYTELRTNIYTVPVLNKINVQICPGDVNYIAYNAEWLENLYKKTKNKWAVYAVIAHEIGHYVYAHDRKAGKSSPKLEEEADEYAGETLARMNVSLEDAQAAYKALQPTLSDSHPVLEDRLAAVERGWNRIANRGLSSNVKPMRRGPSSDVKTVEIGSTGYIDGLNGRLNPILDSLNRTYLYADNIAIDGGKNQPVNFSLNQPFVVEDSLGNQFELKVLSITSESSRIEYRRLSSAANKEGSNLNVKVVDLNSQPIIGAEILAVFSDGTYLKGQTDSKGNARIENLKERTVTVYCAHPNFPASYKEGHNADSNLIINLKTQQGSGSIIITRTGYIPGLNGRLNPILDSYNRMYLYADNISVDGGKKQPVHFRLNEPFQVRDSNGKSFELKVVSIIGASSLIEFTRLN